METLPTSRDVFFKTSNTTDPKCWVEYLPFARVLLKLIFFLQIFPFRTPAFYLQA